MSIVASRGGQGVGRTQPNVSVSVSNPNPSGHIINHQFNPTTTITTNPSPNPTITSSPNPYDNLGPHDNPPPGLFSPDSRLNSTKAFHGVGGNIGATQDNLDRGELTTLHHKAALGYRDYSNVVKDISGSYAAGDTLGWGNRWANQGPAAPGNDFNTAESRAALFQGAVTNAKYWQKYHDMYPDRIGDIAKAVLVNDERYGFPATPKETVNNWEKNTDWDKVATQKASYALGNNGIPADNHTGTSPTINRFTAPFKNKNFLNMYRNPSMLSTLGWNWAGQRPNGN